MWFMGLGILCMVIFWAVVIGLIIWAVRRNDNRQSNSSGDSAMDIARQRYAKGEITKEQFEQMKKDLKG
jgi:putative membrane protein